MRVGDILILRAHEILSLLAGREQELIDTVRLAYEAHAKGASSLPHSVFLRFPENESNRIIALPAYLGDALQVAGMKWVSSFPGNIKSGLDRASAVLILNSVQTGRPEAILEGSVISAKRTAASAALAAQVLHVGEKITHVGILGCGVINLEITRFLLAVFPEIEALNIFDLDSGRANQFVDKCRHMSKGLRVDVAKDVSTLLASAPLISIATTAIKPHLSDRSNWPQGCTILHVSLRDISPEVIVSCDNVVDDVSHVCRAQTSIHLAEQLTGNRDFITSTLADVLMRRAVARIKPDGIVVFSPFGLGILDIAVGHLVRELAIKQGIGTELQSFLPDSWVERNEVKATSST